MSESSSLGTPWYQNSWPWFIVILLSVAVIASLSSVFIAFRYGDVDVRSSEYKESLQHRAEVEPIELESGD